MTAVLNPFEPSKKIAGNAASRQQANANTDGDLADPGKPGGPADHSDPNPFDAHHVYLLMSTNFPPDAIQWVKRARWTGPQNIPWERIDTDGIKTWAASKQPERVKEFEQMIQAHKGDVKPAILIQDNDSPKAIIIDGHHRSLAFHNLDMPVLSYLGNIDPEDRQAAEETHGKQIHSGASPQNKTDPVADARRYLVTEDLLAKLDGYWYRRETGRPAQRKEVFKTLTELRDAGRDERLLSLEARDFGWSIERLDSLELRAWLCV